MQETGDLAFLCIPQAEPAGISTSRRRSGSSFNREHIGVMCEGVHIIPICSCAVAYASALWRNPQCRGSLDREPRQEAGVASTASPAFDPNPVRKTVMPPVAKLATSPNAACPSGDATDDSISAWLA